MASAASRAEIVQKLAGQLRGVKRAAQTLDQTACLSTGLAPLDLLLPGGGVKPGTLLEWLAEGEGSGAGTVALSVGASLLNAGGTLVVIDLQQEFYPPAARALGIDLDRVVLVHPAHEADALWAWEQALRCPAAAAVLGWVERLNGRVFRRLQLAVEAGGGVGLMLRGSIARTQPAWAEARLLVRPCPSTTFSGRRLRVELLYGRGTTQGGSVEVEITDDKGTLHLASRLAPATPPRRAAGA